MLLARNRGWIGVDIGTHAVKMAQVVRRGDRLALVEATVIQRLEPWEEAALTGAVLRSDEELLAAYLLGESFSGRRAAAILPMALCQLKSMQIADGPPAKRREAVGRELAKVPKTDEQQRDFDFWPTNSALENATIVRENVSVISVPTRWTSRAAQDHRLARLECQALDAVPLALSRALQLTPQADQVRPVAVLDWGFSRATFCIALAGRPLFVRCLRDCEFGTLIRALRNTLNLSWDEARRLAVQYATSATAGTESSAELQRMVANAAMTTISMLTAELDRTLVYLRMHRPKIVPVQLWLFGGGATVRGIAPLLAGHVHLDVRCWDLGEPQFCSDTAGTSPVAMLGGAVALSCLAWEGV